jgi:hypothetical protein
MIAQTTGTIVGGWWGSEDSDEGQYQCDQEDHEQPVVHRDASDDREDDQQQDQKPEECHLIHLLSLDFPLDSGSGLAG